MLVGGVPAKVVILLQVLLDLIYAYETEHEVLSGNLLWRLQVFALPLLCLLFIRGQCV